MQLRNNNFAIKTGVDKEIKLGIYALSKRVGWFSEAKDIARDMVIWLNDNNGIFDRPSTFAYAVSHCQVADLPYAFFVVADDFINHRNLKGDHQRNKTNFYFRAQAIFNARIIAAPEKIERMIPRREVATVNGEVSSVIKRKLGVISNVISVPDACMSFPYKKGKNTERNYRIKVRYQIATWYGLRTVTEWVEGIKSHVFQHEIDHANGINIYYGKGK